MRKVALLALAAVVAGGGTAAPPEAQRERLDRRLSTILAIEDRRSPRSEEIRLLVQTATSAEPGARGQRLRTAAIRALGRLGRRDTVDTLVGLTADANGDVRIEAAVALALTLRSGEFRLDDPVPAATIDRLLAMSPPPSAVLGHLPYTSPEQIRAAEARLREQIEERADPPAAPIRALEALARRQRALAPLRDESIAVLKRIATRFVRTAEPAPRRNAMAALLSAGALDEETIEHALGDDDEEVRRLGALALAGTGASLDPTQRGELTRQALRDRSVLVRIEAVRAWARGEAASTGCRPLLDALSDGSLHVVLAAIDALGQRCLEDAGITDLLASEARTPPTTGPWQREAHALASLARRSRTGGALSLPAFAGHQVWQVRMYAARAAASLEDAATLERLAYDREPNVREAALGPLRALRGADADDAFVAALGEKDYQLLRTAAISLKGATPSRRLRAALLDGLQRVTREGKDTSRDTRLALLERLIELGDADLATALEPLARDFDPVIAEAASRAYLALTSRRVEVRPTVLPRPPPPAAGELAEPLQARVTLDSGRTFDIGFLEDRPLSSTRFVRLARAGYYDGLTFHRVVSNFVVQGGSPGANEYAGDGPHMRDELGPVGHQRGTVGISTRGLHTGDAQIFINLVDNPRLDFEYTVFGRVAGSGMAAVDAIQEGTVIRRIVIQRREPEPVFRAQR